FFNKKKKEKKRKERWIGMELGSKKRERSRESREQRENNNTARGRAWRDCEIVGKGQGTRVWSKEDAWIRAESVHVSHPIFYFVVRTPCILSASGLSLT
ncbi:hypothetical protein VIGAN_01034200, partial [Vigna angularis var. angularis]